MFLVLFLLPAFFFSSSAQAGPVYGCPDYVEPEVNVEVSLPSPRYNETLSLREMAYFAQNGKSSILGTANETPVGFTMASLKMDTHYDIAAYTYQGQNKACGQVKTFTLDLGFEDVVIYLARELSQGTCSYNTVLWHEREHVQIDRDLAVGYERILPEKISKILDAIGMVEGENTERVKTIISGQISAKMKELLSSLSEVRSAHQKEIDTSQEYARLSKSCNGELDSLVGDARHATNKER